MPPSPQVFNAGWAGDATADLLRRFRHDVALRAPDLVILWAGVNDCLYPPKRVGLPVYQASYLELLEQCRAIGARVLIATLPPQYPPLLFEQFPAIATLGIVPEQVIGAANAWLRSLDAPLADFEAVVCSRPIGEDAASFLQNPANSGRRDGLHLTAAGAASIAACARAAIATHELPHRRVVCLGDSLTRGVGLQPATESYPAQLSNLLRLEATPGAESGAVPGTAAESDNSENSGKIV